MPANRPLSNYVRKKQQSRGSIGFKSKEKTNIKCRFSVLEEKILVDFHFFYLFFSISCH